eukprot:392016_1
MAQKTGATWKQYAQVAKKMGFSRCTIVNRHNFEIIAKTGIAPNYPCQWQDGEKVINELAQLNANWTKKTKKIFYFYGMKFEITHRGVSGKWIKCQNENEYLFAFQFKEIWFVVYYENKGSKEELFIKIKGLLAPI